MYKLKTIPNSSHDWSRGLSWERIVNSKSIFDAIGEEYIIEDGDEVYVQEVIFYTRVGYLIKQTRETLLEFEEAFLKAGFPSVTFNLRANEYWESDSITGPWVNAFTDIGKIRVGWRKRVIAVEFDESVKIDIPKIITDNVTKDVRLFHAWDLDKLAEYLKLSREYILNNRKTKETIK